MEEMIWSAKASKDVFGIYQYIAVDSRSNAKRWINKIMTRVTILYTQPEIGRIVPERNDPKIRELIEGNYRIMYKLGKNQIIIYRIMNVAQKF